MATPLDQGGSLESLTVTPSFPRVPGSGRLVVPDTLFPEIKGSLRYNAGNNPAATTVGNTAMGASAKGVIKGANFVVGFKQVATIRFHVALYAGIKDSDGSIDEGSTGLNFRNLLDCAANEALQSPQAPFYLPRVVAPNGSEFTISMPDQPAGKVRLQRRNSLRDRLNFLVAFRTHTEFLTYLVVERPDGTHLPIKGFGWRYAHNIDVAWANGKPSIQLDVGGAFFDSMIDSLRPGEPRFDILANPALGTANTVVTRFNTAMFAAQNRNPTGDYAITEFANYSENITPPMQGRIISTSL